MEKTVERMGQFLLDNAKKIAREMRKTNHYRSFQMSLDVHKHSTGPEMKVEISVYDEKTTHYYLAKDEISTKGLRRICSNMNRESKEK